MPGLEKQLNKNAIARQKIIQLHMKDLIDIEEIKVELMTLREKKKDLKNAIRETLATNQTIDVPKAEIKHADPSTLRMVVNNLFQVIKINPKTKKSKHPQSRIIELKGISIPFTGVKVASPRGFEPLSPP